MDIDWRLGAAVLGGLVGFGVVYDRWVGRLERRGHDRGYMALIVSLGCAVTGAGYTLWIGQPALGLVLLACFVASGTPMMWGSIARHVQQRTREERLVRGEAKEALGHGGQGDPGRVQGPGSVDQGDTGE